MKHIERTEQTLFFKILALNENRHPAIRWIHCSLNGARLRPVTALQMKAMGMKAGIADVFVPWPNQNGRFMFLEFKSPSGLCTQKQIEFGLYCQNAKIDYYVVRSAVEALRLVAAHLDVNLKNLPMENRCT